MKKKRAVKRVRRCSAAFSAVVPRCCPRLASRMGAYAIDLLEGHGGRCVRYPRRAACSS
ncbi:hypothetical protein KCP75_21605 [Salmonella enterica subsp. enterica]|nr:hypothetical protein KCP75_21605 [Salmonella enterica subsp. enterica]